MLELRIATELARFVPDPTGAAEARGWVAASLARFKEGHGTRDLREAALLLDAAAAQAMAPAAVSTSTSTPSATR
jgi:hypothetical protein